MTQTILDRVIEHVAGMNPKRHITVDAETELYKQLGIYGDDVFFDLVLWAEREFGVLPDLSMINYVPAEHSHPRVKRFIRSLLHLPEPEFQSFTVRDVAAAIERKSWQSDE